MDKKLLNISEASDMTGINRRTLYLMIKAKKIPAMLIGAKKGIYFIKREDLEAFFNQKV